MLLRRVSCFWCHLGFFDGLGLRVYEAVVVLMLVPNEPYQSRHTAGDDGLMA